MADVTAETFFNKDRGGRGLRNTYALQFRFITPTIRPVGCFSELLFSDWINLVSLTRTSFPSISASSAESSASSFFNVAWEKIWIQSRYYTKNDSQSWSTTSSPGAFHSFSSKTSTTTTSPSTALFIFSRPTRSTGLVNPGTGTLPSR